MLAVKQALTECDAFLNARSSSEQITTFLQSVTTRTTRTATFKLIEGDARVEKGQRIIICCSKRRFFRHCGFFSFFCCCFLLNVTFQKRRAQKLLLSNFFSSFNLEQNTMRFAAANNLYRLIL